MESVPHASNTSNIKKCKLSKDWIVIESKSRPDKVYYFNVRTNESTWTQPSSDQVAKVSLKHISKRRKNYDKKDYLRAKTPEHELVKGKTICQSQLSHNKEDSPTVAKIVKEKDTPQMIVIREKMLQKKMQKSSIKNKFQNLDQTHSSPLLKTSLKSTRSNKEFLPLEKSYSNKESDKTIVSSPRGASSRLTRHNKSTACLDQTDGITCTPQMRVLYEKIHRKSIDNSGSDKKAKITHKSKQQQLEIINQPSIKTCEKNIVKRQNIEYNKDAKKDERSNPLKKNIAKERMYKLRKSLNFDKGKLVEEIGCSVTTEKSSQKLNKSLPTTYCNKSFGTTSTYKSTDARERLKRLHNRELKSTLYEKNTTLNKKISQIEEPITSNMRKGKLIEQVKREVTYEEMDWEPMNDEEITLEVEVVRNYLGRENNTNTTNCISENAIELTKLSKTQGKDPLYIIIDTNVFLSNIEIIEKARDMTFKAYPRPFIVIPWTVIRELDYLKDDKSRSETLRIKARKAISFLNKHFSSKHPRVIGQTREQAAKNKKDFSPECPDDEILQCCLQIRQLQKSVILLSYDKNLCTKAMIYDIVALGRDDPLEKIDYLNVNDKTINVLNDNSSSVKHSPLNEELRLSDDIFEDTKTIMKDFLSTIIVKQMSEIYGSEWEMYVIIKPPWTIITALKCTIKHWIAAINESFERLSIHILKELLQAFEHFPIGGRKLQDVKDILEKCSDVIRKLNIDKHYELMTQSLDVIMELKKRCLKNMATIDEEKLLGKIGIAKDAQEQEHRAENTLQCFKHIYSYARDFCGLAAEIAGKAFPINFNPLNPPLTRTIVIGLQPEITRKVTDLTQNLNKLLVQTEDSIKYETLLNLQQNLNTFLAGTGMVKFDVELLDIYCCAKLRKDILRMGLGQLQELSTHCCALINRT